MQDYKKIEVWKKAHKLVLDMYIVTSHFPSTEQFEITSQLKRAAVSIPTNISEGSGKRSNNDFSRYLQIAFGSASEVEYLLFLSYELKFMDSEKYNGLIAQILEIKKMIFGLIKKLKTNH